MKESTREMFTLLDAAVARVTGPGNPDIHIRGSRIRRAIAFRWMESKNLFGRKRFVHFLTGIPLTAQENQNWRNEET